MNTLADNGWQLSAQQAEAIRKHLDLIKNSGNEFDDFTGWLEGVLDLWDKCDAVFSSTMTYMIMKKLGDKFEHIVKPPVIKIDLNKLKERLPRRKLPNRMTC